MPTDAPYSIAESAEALAKENARSAPEITRVYHFPATGEIHLVIVDPNAPPNKEKAVAFYFAPYGGKDGAYASGIALIRPEEEGSIPLPDCWGTWADGKIVYEKPANGD